MSSVPTPRPPQGPQPELYRAALHYATALKIPIFPCVPKEKKPLTSNGFKDATTNAEIIHQWWRKYPNANIGTPTGNRFIVIDVDLPEGPDTLAELQRKNKDIPITPQSITGGGGRQLFFLAPNVKIKNSVKIFPGIDVRGSGGYVVLPPSIHPNGHSYKWLESVSMESVGLAAIPEWLLVLLSEIKPLIATDQKRSQLTFGVTYEGARNQMLTRLTGMLLARGVHPFLTSDLIRAWNKFYNIPPLSDIEVEGIFQSICGRECDKFSGKRYANF